MVITEPAVGQYELEPIHGLDGFLVRWQGIHAYGYTVSWYMVQGTVEASPLESIAPGMYKRKLKACPFLDLRRDTGIKISHRQRAIYHSVLTGKCVFHTK